MQAVHCGADARRAGRAARMCRCNLIEHIEIENFKCFRTLARTQLGRFTIVSGQNDAGKTALLEAIFLCGAPWIQSDGILQPYVARGLTGTGPSPDSLWGPLFHAYDTSVAIEVGLDHRSFKLSISDFVPQETPGAAPIGAVALQPRPKRKALCVQQAEQRVYHYPGESGNIETYIEHATSPFPVAAFCAFRHRSRSLALDLGTLDEQNRIDEVVTHLRIIDDRIRDVAVIPAGNQPAIHCDIGIGRKLPLALLGDGVSRTLELLLPTLLGSDATVLMDDIDAGLHYSVQADAWKALISAASERENQIIATTHNYEFLARAAEAFPDELAEQFRFIRLERLSGQITAHSVDLAAVRSATQSDFELR